MKARLVSKLPESGSWLYELKFDGYRALAVKHGNRVHLLSRKNLSLNSQFPELVKAIKELPVKNAVIDGEVVALDEKGDALPFWPFIRPFNRTEPALFIITPLTLSI